MDADKFAKQVIVIRRDLGMRRGKEIAQGGHASMSWLMDRMVPFRDHTDVFTVRLSAAELAWARGLFTKIVCRVNSEAELTAVGDKAQAAGLTVYGITDAGKTEFHGEPTLTAIAIGPHWSDEIDPVTRDLRLY